MTITNEQKEGIRKQLELYVGRYPSKNKAAESLKDVSAATISQVLNHNWELISEKMWKLIGIQVDWTAEGDEWAIADTRAFMKCQKGFSDAKQYGNVWWVKGEAGCGKTTAIALFQKKHENVMVLRCDDYWSRAIFLEELLMQMGVNPGGLTTGERVREIVRGIKLMDKPLLIMDEADKLADSVFSFFITLYNNLNGYCGMVLCATDQLETRIRKGVRLNKKGYKEIKSRLGGTPVRIPSADLYDIEKIARANGITDYEQLQKVKDVAKVNENDLRKVKNTIHALRMMNENAEQN